MEAAAGASYLIMARVSPPCPRCAKPMRLARIVPAVAGHPELCTFECVECREVTTIEAKPATALE